jgi:hypothetical protein
MAPGHTGKIARGRQLHMAQAQVSSWQPTRPFIGLIMDPSYAWRLKVPLHKIDHSLSHGVMVWSQATRPSLNHSPAAGVLSAGKPKGSCDSLSQNHSAS